jgi:hypothetical protein
MGFSGFLDEYGDALNRAKESGHPIKVLGELTVKTSMDADEELGVNPEEIYNYEIKLGKGYKCTIWGGAKVPRIRVPLSYMEALVSSLPPGNDTLEIYALHEGVRYSETVNADIDPFVIRWMDETYGAKFLV